MKILLLDAYFYPEKIAFSHLENDLIDSLVSGGNEIAVLCPTPTRGTDCETIKRYGSIRQESIHGGLVCVNRFWAPQEGKNPIMRAFRYLWCNLQHYWCGKKYESVDAICTVSTPPTQGFVAGRLAKKMKIPHIYLLQDVFPDSLVTTGMTHKGSLLWKLGRKIEDFTYRNADQIIVISESMKRNILEKGVPEKKITVIPNWIDTETVKPVPKEANKLFEEFGVDPEKFIVLYAGNFGAAQGAGVVLKVAELLQENTNIQFVIFGGGFEFGAARQYVQEHRLENVIINDLLPQDRVSEVYSLGDVALITCKKGVGNSGMPSKTWSIMACNTPIIASFDMDSELHDILRYSGAGVCIPAEDVLALKSAIQDAYEVSRVSNEVARTSRTYVVENASKNICVSRYIEVLRKSAQTNPERGVSNT